MIKIQMLNRAQIGRTASRAAAASIRSAIAADGEAVIVLATGASQEQVLAALTLEPDIAWPRVTVFHLDEYIGLHADHPASFRRYLRDRFMTPLCDRPRLVAIAGESDVDGEIARLSALIRHRAISVCFAGLGTNGHLAFNDPPADFVTDAPFIRVRLSETNRQQQRRDGWFDTLDAVPREAITMSIRQIMKSRLIIVPVTGAHKAQVVRAVVEGPVTPDCPASILQTHPQAVMMLDEEAARLLADRHALKECPSS